jgi:uncharacterized membrane protein YkvA (DUF1232 family)
MLHPCEADQVSSSLPRRHPAEAASSADTSWGERDPFPREPFVRLVGHLPRYLRLAVGLAGEPRLPRSRRAALLAAAAYLASPIDLVPGVIPVVGQLDDIAVALLALRAALRALDPVTRAEQLMVAGLAPDDLDTDLGALGQVAGWLARRGIAIGRRLAILAASASLAIAASGVRAARRGAPVVVRAGGRLARTMGSSLTRAGRSGAGLVARRVRPGGIDGLGAG